MKSFMTAALVIGLFIFSCKKENQTTYSEETNTVSTTDSTSTNSSSTPTDSMTTVLPPGGSGVTDSTSMKGDSSVTTAR